MMQKDVNQKKLSPLV